MVDNNNNQWEDESQYDDMVSDDDTDTLTDDSYDDDEVSDTDDEYSEYEDESEDEEDDDLSPKKKKNNLPLLILIIVLLLVGLFIAIPKLTNKGENNTANKVVNKQEKLNDNAENNVKPETNDADAFFGESGSGDNNMMSVDFNDSGNEINVTTGEGDNQQVATVTEAQPGEGINESDLFAEQPAQENDSIMVVYNKASRSNPFKPPVNVGGSSEVPYETINDTQFEIIEPPVTAVKDEHLTKLLQTEISGILYDKSSPSAIVNINGSDQFVKVGDVISGFKIVNITKDKVQISYKNNSYVASVGELFTKGDIDFKPAVVNLENKFAGRYKNKN